MSEYEKELAYCRHNGWISSPDDDPIEAVKKPMNAASLEFGIRIELVIAIISRETNCQNIVGDRGHGRGLCQVDDRSWGSWLKDNNGGMNPASNIHKGMEILKTNLDHFNGDEFKAVAAYNCGQHGVHRAMAEGKSPEAHTTGGNYASDVLERAGKFKELICSVSTIGSNLESC